MKVAIILHENDVKAESGVYFIQMIARFWRNSGHDVIFVNGIQKNTHADLALLHVNLSVVPEEYVAYAKQFPISLNVDITDIRKRNVSQQLVHKDDDYDGSVIIKTDLNSGGIPEEIIYDWPRPKPPSIYRYWRGLIRRTRNLAIKLNLIDQDSRRFVKTKYRESFRIYGSKNHVPNHVWSNKDWVVEKYIPEVKEGIYVTRNAYFLGTKTVCFKNVSDDPIVKDNAKGEIIDTPDMIKKYRQEIGLDYGKIDYVLRDGKPVILDVTKTVGGDEDPEFAKNLASGINSYMDAYD